MRYRYLDELLSSRVRYYTRQELTDIINQHLSVPVSKRCIEKDLIDIQNEWGIEYDEKIYNGKKHIHYADPSFSIFNKELTAEERTLLKSVLDTVGQFNGLPNFEWLKNMRLKLSGRGNSAISANDLEDNSDRRIIEFSSNPYLKNIGGGIMVVVAANIVVLAAKNGRMRCLSLRLPNRKCWNS